MFQCQWTTFISSFSSVFLQCFFTDLRRRLHWPWLDRWTNQKTDLWSILAVTRDSCCPATLVLTLSFFIIVHILNSIERIHIFLLFPKLLFMCARPSFSGINDVCWERPSGAAASWLGWVHIHSSKHHAAFDLVSMYTMFKVEGKTAEFTPVLYSEVVGAAGKVNWEF